MRHAGALICSMVMAMPVWAQNGGLTAPGARAETPRWQARLEREAEPVLSTRAGTPLWLLDMGRPQTVRLLGDYQFDSLRLGPAGGLRLTGGLLLSTRNMTLGGGATTDNGLALGQMWGSGYAGVGYASSSARGDWGFNADLGLSAFRFGQPAPGLGNQGPGLRDARQGPVLRLGMSLTF